MKAFFAMLFAVLAAITPIPAAAQAELADEPKPDPFVKTLEARYQALSYWGCVFTQTSHVDVLNQDVTREGSIAVAKPSRMRIDYAGDPKKVYIVNGKKLWVYQPDANVADEFDDPEKLISREALSFLGGLGDIGELFDAIPNLPEAKEFFTIKDAALKKISLVPKDATSPILRITLGVDEKTTTVKEAVLYNASGNVTHYAFSDVSFDQPVEAAAFELPKDIKIEVTQK
jgi:outer membrane lipoprotein-sorting protein